MNKYAKSMICINKLIYIYNYNQDSLMSRKNNNLYLKNLLYWHEMLKKLFDDKKSQIFLTKRSSLILKVIRRNLSLIKEIINDKNLINSYINF